MFVITVQVNAFLNSYDWVPKNKVEIDKIKNNTAVEII